MGVIGGADGLPWDMLEAESAKAFAAFAVYRDLGRERSIDHAYERLTGRQLGNRRAPGRWGAWSTLHHWDERARAYDAALDARARAATEEKTIERRRRMLQRHSDEAEKLQEIAKVIREEFNDRVSVRGGMKFVDARLLVTLLAMVPKMVDTGQKLERLAEGEATERHEHTMTIEQAAQMTDDELDDALREMKLL